MSLLRSLLATALLLLGACAAPEPAGDATMPAGPEGLEGDL